MSSFKKLYFRDILKHKSKSIIICVSITLSIMLLMSIDILIQSNAVANKELNTGIAKNTLGLLYLMPLIIGIIVMVFIYSTFKLYILENTKLYGTLRALGVNRYKIFFLVLLQGLTYAIISIPLGIGLGFNLCKIFMWFSNMFLRYDLQNFPIILTGHSIAVAIAYGITSILISILYPALKACLTSPVEAMYNTKNLSMDNETGVYWNFVTKFSNYKWKLILRDLYINRSKTFFIVMIFSLALIMVICLSSVLTYINQFGDKSKVNAFDFQIVNKNGFSEEYISSLLKIPYIESINRIDDHGIWASVDISKINNRSSQSRFILKQNGKGIIPTILVAYDNNLIEKTSPFIKSGEVLTNSENEDDIIVFISESYISTINNTIEKEPVFHLSAGDYVELDLDNGQEPYTFRIKAVVNDLPYMPSLNNPSNVYYILPIEKYNEILNKSNDSSLMIKLNYKYNEKKFQSFINEDISNGNITEYTNFIRYKSSVRNDAEFRKYCCLFFTFMLFILGAIITGNILVGNIFVKSRQYLLYKIIGINNKTINNFIVKEILVYVVSSLVIGFTIGIPLSKFIFDKVVKIDGIKQYKLPLLDISLYIILIVIVALVAYLVSIRQIKKVTVITNHNN